MVMMTSHCSAMALRAVVAVSAPAAITSATALRIVNRIPPVVTRFDEVLTHWFTLIADQ